MKRPALFAAYAGLDRSIYALFVGSTVIWTLGEILSATNSSVYIANLSPMSHRGRFNAIAPLIMGALALLLLHARENRMPAMKG